jgi:uncharacterized protein
MSRIASNSIKQLGYPGMQRANYVLVLIVAALSLLGCSNRSKNEGNMIVAAEAFSDPRLVRLAEAINHESVSDIEQLVRSGTPANGRGNEGITPLIYAGAQRKKRSLQKLLLVGADPNLLTDGGMSLVMLCAGSDDIDLLRIVLEAGGNPNLTNDHKEPVTFTAARQKHWENLRLLLRRGADINGRDSTGYTLTLFLAEVDRYEWVHRLLEMGADPNVRNRQGWTLANFVQTSRIVDTSEPGGWKIRVKTFLEHRGIHFPPPAPVSAR